MTRIGRRFLVLLFALLAATPAAFAQVQRQYSRAELDQMLAPVALYPDPLLQQVLLAATYPVEVVEAARWTRAHPGLQGDDAVRTAQIEDWDPSVKALVAFPQVLQRMDENIGWTRSLGDAFLAQESQVMDTVQQLRQRAQAAGNLQSSEQIYVEQQGPTIVLQPASPRFVYVPYYDPLVVYGPWWWPEYRPVTWAPWPGYVRHYRPGFSVGFWWGRPVGLSANFFFSASPDWRERRVRAFDGPGTVPRFERRPAPGQAQSAAAAQAQPRPDRVPRFERRPAPVQAQPAATVQARPQPQAPRFERRPAPVQAQPAATVQAQPQPQAPRFERRPAPVQAQPAVTIQAQPQPRQAAPIAQQPVAAQAQARPAMTVQAQPQQVPQPRTAKAHPPQQRRVEHTERHG